MRMIQPVSAFSPRAGFRGSNKSYGRSSVKPTRTKSEIALMNAAGTSALAGAVTTAVARSYTPSWGQAFVLGLCGSLLTMFFIAPRLVENTNLFRSNKKAAVDGGVPVDAGKPGLDVKKAVKPVKKLVQFKQS